MTRLVPLPDALSGTPFTTAMASAAGVPNRRLRARDIHSPFHGAHLDNSVDASVANLCHAFSLGMSRTHAFSHTTAALLYGLPVPLYATHGTDTHVAVPADRRQPRGRGVAGHSLAIDRWASQAVLERDFVTGELFELNVVAPSVVWAQMAEVLDPDDLVALGDALVTGELTPIGTEVMMGQPLTSISELTNVTVSWAGSRGSQNRSRAIPHIRVGSLSRTETLTRLMVIRAGVPEPLLNVVACAPDGTPIRMADLLWIRERVLTEYEGEDHRTARGKFRGDISKFEEYADAEWHGLRVHADDLFVDPNVFIARLWRRLVARGWEPPRKRKTVEAARR